MSTETDQIETKTVDLGSMVSGLKTRLSGGRVWAYVGSLLGGLVSVSANIRHSFIVPDGRPVDWSPETMQVGFSVLGPVFLFIGLEVLARIPWYKAPRWVSWPIRVGGVLPVTVVSGFISYQHMAGLMGFWGEDPFVQHSFPIAVDGLMVLCSAAVYITGPNFAKRLAETQALVSASAVSVRKSPVSTVPTPKTAVSVWPAAARVETAQTRSIQAETPETAVPATRAATVSSLMDQSDLTAKRLAMIKAAEPNWMIKIPTKARVGEIISNKGGQTQQNLRIALIAEAKELAAGTQEASTPDDARELVSAI